MRFTSARSEFLSLVKNRGSIYQASNNYLPAAPELLEQKTF
jgi:hypothetical protein